MKETNILILGVGGNVSQGIITAVRHSSIPHRIIGACISPESLGLYMCDTAYVSPYAQDPHFVDWVANLCMNESVDIVFTGVEEIITALETNRAAFESKTKAIFVSSTLDDLKIGGDKLLTSEWLKANGFNYPKYASNANSEEIERLIEQCGYPLIAKPRKGKGSSGIFKINSREDIAQLPDMDYCVQEYLGDEKKEYTAACYIDKDGVQQEMIIMRRDLKYGTTFLAEIVDNSIIREECIKICAAFKPKGPLNIQLRII